jgi:hypothetical protein
VHADGESYEGGFQYGRRQGSGIYTFCDGASFVGVFHDDMPRGKGICTLPGGRCFHGDFALFAAYLRTTRGLRGNKGKDAWVHESWQESSDLLRNPPWEGFNAVRPGFRHYEEGFSTFKHRDDAPPLAPRTFAVDWPHPLRSVNALDLHTPRRLVARTVLAEWPRVKAPPREIRESEVVEEDEQEYIEWKVGDVCECQDMVGASMATLGRPELSGKLVPQRVPLYFKVRIDEVEYVWPGFTESNFPLVICRVTYVGCDHEKPSEWVPSSRLRSVRAFLYVCVCVCILIICLCASVLYAHVCVHKYYLYPSSRLELALLICGSTHERMCAHMYSRSTQLPGSQFFPHTHDAMISP